MSDYLTMTELESSTLKDIYAYAKELKIPYYSQMNRKELSSAVIRAQAEKQGFFFMEGILDIVSQDGYDFLWPINYGPSTEDTYISSSQIRRFGLRNGDKVAGEARPPKESERYYGLIHVENVNGKDPEEAKERPHFPVLTPLYPEKQLTLEATVGRLSTQVIDVFAPIGFGQRGLIVAPPKAGKTSVLKEVVNGIIENHPDVELILLLIDECPEEVTDLERSVKSGVVSSTFDQQPQNHMRVAELILDRAMRLVEDKRNVVILMDSITRLTRVYNLVTPPSGRILSSGIDPATFFKPKRFFGAVRNIEEGGSLAILATALVDTGSRMDDAIHEEFKDTGNMGPHLSHELVEHRIFLAIDIKKSSTRKEELLMTPEQLEETRKLRNNMLGDSLEYADQFIRMLKRTQNNQQLFEVFHDVSFGEQIKRNPKG